MVRLEKLRVVILAVVAASLAVALAVHLLRGGGATSTPISSLWRASLGGEEIPAVGSITEADRGESKDAPPTDGAVMQRNGDESIYIDGGDVPDSELAPTPTNTPTPTLALERRGESVRSADERGAADTVAPTPSPTVGSTPAPEEQMLGGIGVVRGGLPSGTPQGTVGSALPWVSGQARGYTMLYALQPEAQPVTESNISALLAARIREPHIGVLIDGTFGRDYEYLKDIIRRLNSGGRDLHLALYVSNGATQRRWRSTRIDAPFVRINPEDFRQDIRRNVVVRAQYSELAATARRLFEYNLSLNPEAKNFAVVMLEDNLDRESFRAMVGLALEQLDGVATLVRNPCEECGVSGTDVDPLGYPREEHGVERFSQLKERDAFSLDGTGFSYPSETQSKGVSSEQLRSLVMQGYEKGLSYFGLWRGEWQGVNSDGENVEPGQRSYVPSSADQMEFEMQVLRGGLPLEDEGSEDLTEGGTQSDDM